MKKGLLKAHQAIAGIFYFHRYYPRDREALRDTLVAKLCEHYASEYPGFDKDAFIAACGQSSPHRRTLVEGAPIPHEAFDDPFVSAVHPGYIEEARD